MLLILQILIKGLWMITLGTNLGCSIGGFSFEMLMHAFVIVDKHPKASDSITKIVWKRKKH